MEPDSVRTRASLPQSSHVTSTAIEPVAPPAVTVARFDLGAVYAREYDWVWHTLRRFGVASRNLADVTHDTFVVVHRRAADYDPSRPLRPWLFGIAWRVARDHLALGRNRRESITDEIEAVDPEAPQDQRIARAQAWELVVAALQSVELERRAVFILHDIEETPMPEVAAALDVPLKTLYTRLRLAREEFTAAVRRLKLQRGERP